MLNRTDSLAAMLLALDADSNDAIRKVVEELHPADVGDLLESLPPDNRYRVLAEIPRFLIGETLMELPDSIRVDLVSEMDQADLVAAAQTLDTDDIADLIPDLPDEVIAQILSALDQQDRERLDAVLSFPEDTAGGLMNVDTITVRENLSLEVVLHYLRGRGEMPDDTNKLFVVDRKDHLVGNLYISKLLTTDPRQRVGAVMDREPVKFDALITDNEVAAAFERYNLISAPVVDSENRLLGRITIDDVVDVIREEADHSVMAPAGLSEGEDIFAPVARSSRKRALWLGVNLITAVVASMVIGFFEDTIQKIVALAVLMPIVASMGGNAGTQTVVLVVRGLALGTITRGNTRQLLLKEMMVSVVNSMLWALVVALVAVAWYRDPVLGLVIALAMMINLMVAALFGVIIPIMLRRVGVDPALASGVMLTAITDVVGFFSFLGLAALLLL
ncbi:MAG: magnesium transporter [Acidiferrobacterales bacterium]